MSIDLQRKNPDLKEPATLLEALVKTGVHMVDSTSVLDGLLAHCRSCDSCKAKMQVVVDHARMEGWKL